MPLTLCPGQTEQPFYRWARPDNHDEEAETLEVDIFRADEAPVLDGVAVGTTNSMGAMPAAFPSRFWCTVAGQVLDRICDRMAAQRPAPRRRESNWLRHLLVIEA